MATRIANLSDENLRARINYYANFPGKTARKAYNVALAEAIDRDEERAYNKAHQCVLPEGFYWAKRYDGDWTVAEQLDGMLWVVGSDEIQKPVNFLFLVPFTRPLDLPA